MVSENLSLRDSFFARESASGGSPVGTALTVREGREGTVSRSDHIDEGSAKRLPTVEPWPPGTSLHACAGSTAAVSMPFRLLLWGSASLQLWSPGHNVTKLTLSAASFELGDSFPPRLFSLLTLLSRNPRAVVERGCICMLLPGFRLPPPVASVPPVDTATSAAHACSLSSGCRHSWTASAAEMTWARDWLHT